MIKSLRSVFLALFVAVQLVVYGQPAERPIRVLVIPNHTNWLYQPREKAKFKVTVLKRSTPQDHLEMHYEISKDMMKLHQTGKQPLRNEKLKINVGAIKKEGFPRCRAFVSYQERGYGGVATVGLDPEKLQLTTSLPIDFLEFQKSTKEAVEKWALEPIVILLPEECTGKVDVYHVSFANNDYAPHMYGILCAPKALGKYPTILKIPGVDIRAYNGHPEHAGNGPITLEISIYGIPVSLMGDVYRRFYNGILKSYHSFNTGDRDKYYYKWVYTSYVGAIDFIYTLPEFNGNLAAFGGSQSGALPITIAGLGNCVKRLVSFYPALCDIAGYAHGRAGGWSHTFRDGRNRVPEKIKTIQYFDIVNSARQVKVPGSCTFGYNDMVCPPITTYSTYNMVSTPKELFVAETTAHYAYVEQWSVAQNRVMNFLKSESRSK